jgi:hypothetical protein
MDDDNFPKHLKFIIFDYIGSEDFIQYLECINDPYIEKLKLFDNDRCIENYDLTTDQIRAHMITRIASQFDSGDFAQKKWCDEYGNKIKFNNKYTLYIKHHLYKPIDQVNTHGEIEIDIPQSSQQSGLDYISKLYIMEDDINTYFDNIEYIQIVVNSTRYYKFTSSMLDILRQRNYVENQIVDCINLFMMYNKKYPYNNTTIYSPLTLNIKLKENVNSIPKIHVYYEGYLSIKPIQNIQNMKYEYLRDIREYTYDMSKKDLQICNLLLTLLGFWIHSKNITEVLNSIRLSIDGSPIYEHQNLYLLTKCSCN